MSNSDSWPMIALPAVFFLLAFTAMACGGDVEPVASSVPVQETSPSDDHPGQPDGDRQARTFTTDWSKFESLEKHLDLLQAAIIEQHPDEWTLMNSVLPGARSNFDPRRVIREHGHALNQIPPFRAALYARAIAMKDGAGTAFFNASVVYGYSDCESREHVSMIRRLYLFASPYTADAIPSALLSPYLFTRTEAAEVWGYVLARQQFAREQDILAAKVYLDVLTGDARDEDIQALLKRQLEPITITNPHSASGERTMIRGDTYGTVRYLLNYGEDHHLRAADSFIADYLNARKPTEHIDTYASPIYSGMEDLFVNGHRKTLLAYARQMFDQKRAFQSNYRTVAAIRDVIMHPGFPDTDVDLQDAAHLYDPDDAGRNYVLTVFQFLVSDEFAGAIWHPGLRIWIAP